MTSRITRREWTSIGCSLRGDDLDSGLQARVADPLWMLARQWQFGEFDGDDAASIRDARVHYSQVPITSLAPSARMGDISSARALSRDDLLEPLIEAEDPAFLPSTPRLSGNAGLNLLRRLDSTDRTALLPILQKNFPLILPEGETARGNRLLAALARGSFDAAAFAPMAVDLAPALAAAAGIDTPSFVRTVRAWLASLERRFVNPDNQGLWASDRQCYEARLGLGGTPDRPDFTLEIPDHDGGQLDWFSVDLSADAPSAAINGGGAMAKHETGRMLPSPVRYSGMPADRFWDFEEGEVYFGGITLEEADLPQLVLTEFATVYSNDWFVLPLPAETGHLIRVNLLELRDTFGETLNIVPAALSDKGERPWRFFELTGDPSVAADRAPWLFLPRATTGSETGPAVEEVIFTRDEQANLAWGIERLVESPAGYAVDRAQEWASLRDTIPEYLGDDSPPEDEAWVYRLLSVVPGHWVPFLPIVHDDLPQGRMQRARMGEWDLLGPLKPKLAGPRGRLMDKSAPMELDDAALRRDGSRSQRRYQIARSPDGQLLLWASRGSGPAGQARSSDRRTDTVDRPKRGGTAPRPEDNT